LYANPAEEQGGIWIVVASAGTMSHFTDKSGTTSEFRMGLRRTHCHES
jgi:hypothetical protein